MLITQELIKKLRTCGGGPEGMSLVNKAANRLEQLETQLATVIAERDKAIEDLTGVLKDTDNASICDFCEFYQPCMGKEDCEFYEEGIGVTIDGVGYNFKWNCLDFDICRKRENTPCEGCDFERHFKWRGLGNESKTSEQSLKERS